MEEREEGVLLSFPLTTGVRASVSLRLRLGRLSLSVSVCLCELGQWPYLPTSFLSSSSSLPSLLYLFSAASAPSSAPAAAACGAVSPAE